MSWMASPPLTLPFPGDLVLREARPTDLEQIGELLADRGEDTDALDHRLVVEDPDAGWAACAVVVDGDRVVSTATLLDETLSTGRGQPAGRAGRARRHTPRLRGTGAGPRADGIGHTSAPQCGDTRSR